MVLLLRSPSTGLSNQERKCCRQNVQLSSARFYAAQNAKLHNVPGKCAFNVAVRMFRLRIVSE